MKALTPTWMLALLLLVGCGGGGSTPTAEQVEDELDTEPTLEAARDFDFDISYEATVYFSEPTGEEGTFFLFSERVEDELDEEGNAIADPSSKITSVPHGIDSETITVNSNWEALYAEWHPTTADASQQSLTIELDGQTSINVQFN